MPRVRGIPSALSLAALTVGTLEVTGAATFAATVTATGQFLAGDGSAGAPAYSFTSDPDTGIHLRSVGVLQFNAAGGELLRLSASNSQFNTAIIFATTNVFDIGATAGASCPRSIYAGTSITTPLLYLSDTSSSIYESLGLNLVNVDGSRRMFFTNGTRITANPGFQFSETWNDAGVAFVGVDTNITATLYAAASMVHRWRVGGTQIAALRADGVLMANYLGLSNGTAFRGYIQASADGAFSMYSSAGAALTSLSFGSDVSMCRDAANILALKNGTNPQEVRVYGTTTGPVYASLSHDGNNVILGNVGASVIYIKQNGSLTWSWSAAGHLLTVTDNTYDIGASGNNRPRNVYIANDVFIGNAIQAPAYRDAGANQVVGARGAAVADATGAGDVVAQLNSLLARCRAHGLIAT